MSRAISIGLLAGAVAATVLSAVPLGPYAWYVSRAAGLGSFVALSGSVVLGLLLSSRSGPRWLPKAGVFELHQFLAVLGVGLVALHGAALLFDSTIRFNAVDLLVPFAASYSRGWVALGVIAAWLSGAVTASFWVKKRIGQKAWRRFHYVSFAAYLAGLGHGIGAGTDTQVPAVYWMYVLSGALVTALIVFRVLVASGSRTTSRSKRPLAQVRANPKAPAHGAAEGPDQPRAFAR